MSAWTPGPWVVFNSPKEDQEIIGVTSQAEEHMDSDGDGADVCELSNVGYFDRKQVDANARLIASAPALVSALEDAVHRVRWLMQFSPDADVPAIEEELARWDAALRLARGEDGGATP